MIETIENPGPGGSSLHSFDDEHFESDRWINLGCQQHQAVGHPRQVF
jgi:hypothetical protein